VSLFEKDPTLLMQKISDVKCDGMQTHLYDAIGAAIKMCATASQGGINDNYAEFVILNSIIVLSDGKDEGSAVSRAELIGRIGNMEIPIPVFSLAYSKSEPQYLQNLRAISDATFGRFWGIG